MRPICNAGLEILGYVALLNAEFSFKHGNARSFLFTINKEYCAYDRDLHIWGLNIKITAKLFCRMNQKAAALNRIGPIPRDPVFSLAPLT